MTFKAGEELLPDWPAQTLPPGILPRSAIGVLWLSSRIRRSTDATCTRPDADARPTSFDRLPGHKRLSSLSRPVHMAGRRSRPVRVTDEHLSARRAHRCTLGRHFAPLGSGNGALRPQARFRFCQNCAREAGRHAWLPIWTNTALKHSPPTPRPIILFEPQLGENIGMVARAMANFGLADLRLVNPRDGWPNEQARAAACRADHVIDGVVVFDDAGGGDRRPQSRLSRRPRASATLQAGARPVEAGGRSAARSRPGQRTGILFGRERLGLNNEEVALADAIVTFPGRSRVRLAQHRAGRAADVL